MLFYLNVDILRKRIRAKRRKMLKARALTNYICRLASIPRYNSLSIGENYAHKKGLEIVLFALFNREFVEFFDNWAGAVVTLAEIVYANHQCVDELVITAGKRGGKCGEQGF